MIVENWKRKVLNCDAAPRKKKKGAKLFSFTCVKYFLKSSYLQNGFPSPYPSFHFDENYHPVICWKHTYMRKNGGRHPTILPIFLNSQRWFGIFCWKGSIPKTRPDKIIQFLACQSYPSNWYDTFITIYNFDGNHRPDGLVLQAPSDSICSWVRLDSHVRCVSNYHNSDNIDSFPIVGMIVGYIIRFTAVGQIKSQTMEVMPSNWSSVHQPPDFLRLGIEKKDNTTVFFHYEMIEGFFADTKQKIEEHVERKTVFSPEIFFNIILPPVIFNAGYSLKKVWL